MVEHVDRIEDGTKALKTLTSKATGLIIIGFSYLVNSHLTRI